MEKKEMKIVSLRLDVEDYEKAKEVADFFGYSVGKMLRLCIHMGLLMASPDEESTAFASELEKAVADAIGKMGLKKEGVVDGGNVAN